MDILDKGSYSAICNIQIQKRIGDTRGIVFKIPSKLYIFDITYEDRLIKTIEYDGFKYKVTLEEGLELDELINSRRTDRVLSELSHIKDYQS